MPKIRGKDQLTLHFPHELIKCEACRDSLRVITRGTVPNNPFVHVSMTTHDNYNPTVLTIACARPSALRHATVHRLGLFPHVPSTNLARTSPNSHGVSFAPNAPRPRPRPPRFRILPHPHRRYLYERSSLGSRPRQRTTVRADCTAPPHPVCVSHCQQPCTINLQRISSGRAGSVLICGSASRHQPGREGKKGGRHKKHTCILPYRPVYLW